MKNWQHYLKNGTSLELEPDRCIGCAACIAVCPHAVFRMEAGKTVIAERAACMECGACARNCPTGALRVQPGVGCAAAIIIGKLKGTAPDCGCGCGGEPDDDCADNKKSTATCC
jgi:ferredoxin